MARGKQKSILVVGAGIAGLTAARALVENGHEVTVLEKNDTIGGRMSTRTLFGGVFDDGAQFFTVKDPRFGEMVDRWTEKGIVVDWFHSQLIRGGGENPDGHPRYCGVAGMQSIISEISEGLSIRTSSTVTGIESKKHGYRILLEGGDSLEADSVILTAPVPEALVLLDRSGLKLDPADQEILKSIEYTPCITVLATLKEESALTVWGGLRISGEFIDWIADNRRKGISLDKTAITIQAMPSFSWHRWDEDDEVLAKALLENASILLKAEPDEWKVLRWEHAKPTATHPEAFVAVGSPTLLLAGDGFQGYRVEGAAISGMEAAKRIIQLD